MKNQLLNIENQYKFKMNLVSKIILNTDFSKYLDIEFIKTLTLDELLSLMYGYKIDMENKK